jgi:predicted phosphodiesterase
LIQPICGVELYMTHGHKHRVKQDTGHLLADARASRVAAVLYGHTHVPNCYQESDGLWVLNPGSCGYFGGSAGIIEVAERRIVSCRIIKQDDLV